jgi:hypothetical protein
MANNVGFRHDESGRARADWGAAAVYHVDVKQSSRRGQIAAIGFGRRSMATSSIHRKYCTIDYAIRMRGDGFYCVKVSDASRRNSLGRFDDTEFAQRRGLVGNVGENRAGGDDIDGGVRDSGQLISVWGADWLLGTAGSIHGIAYRKTAAMPLPLYYGCTSGTAGVCTAESVSLNM